MVDRLTVLFLKFLECFHKLQLFIWWLLEIHIIKIVSCYIVLVSINEVEKNTEEPQSAVESGKKRALAPVVSPSLYEFRGVLCMTSLSFCRCHSLCRCLC